MKKHPIRLRIAAPPHGCQRSGHFDVLNRLGIALRGAIKDEWVFPQSFLTSITQRQKRRMARSPQGQKASST